MCPVWKKELDQPGWKRLKRLAKRDKVMTRLLNQAKLHSFRHGVRYKYGVKVPQNHDEAMAYDCENGDTKWRDSEVSELGGIDDFHTFHSLGYHAPPPAGYKKIKCWIIYDVKHDR